MKETLMRELDLTDNEARLYLTLLQTGSSNANTLAKHSGLQRQTVYDALNRLLEKGLASFIHKEGVKHFRPLPPDRLSDLIAQRATKLATIIPELISYMDEPKHDTTVEVHEGDAFRTIHEDIIAELTQKKGEVLISGVDERDAFLRDRFEILHHLQKLRELGCRERVLIGSDDDFILSGPQTLYRRMPKEYFTPTNLFVYANKLGIAILGNPDVAIIIHNTELADSFRRQFNTLWKLAKPLPKHLERHKNWVPA